MSDKPLAPKPRYSLTVRDRQAYTAVTFDAQTLTQVRDMVSVLANAIESPTTGATNE